MKIYLLLITYYSNLINSNPNYNLIDVEKINAKKVVTTITSSNSMDKHSFIC